MHEKWVSRYIVLESKELLTNISGIYNFFIFISWNLSLVTDVTEHSTVWWVNKLTHYMFNDLAPRPNQSLGCNVCLFVRRL